MNKNNSVIIFDCDGTIVDTFLLIEQTVFKTFEKLLPDYPLTKEEADSFFGPELTHSFQKYKTSLVSLDDLVNTYREINETIMPEYIRLFDGILELLKSLKQKGFKLAIVSNKTSNAVIQGLEICNIREYFDLIVGAELLKNPKPDPDGIYQAMNFFHFDKALMIGDTTFDILAGINANVKTVGVTWCQTTRKTFEENGATYIVDSPLEILNILED